MGDAPDPPTPPSAGAVAAQQQGYNTNAAAATQANNSVNQVTPFGNLNYRQTGVGPNGIPTWTATQTLDPTQQRLLDLLNNTKMSAASQASGILNAQPYDGNVIDAIGGYTSGLTGQMLDKATSYLNPYFERDQNFLDTKLKNQGLAPGNPAYDSAMDALHQSQGGIVTNFLSTAQPTAFNQAYQLYMTPAQLSSQLAAEGSPTMPNYVQTPTAQIQPANFIGATANEQQQLEQNYQSQMQQYGNMMSGMFGIPTAILGGWAGSPAGGAAISGALGAMI